MPETFGLFDIEILQRFSNSPAE